MTFSIVACPLLARQGWKNEVMRHKRGLNQGGIDPAQRCKIVGLIRRAGAERSDGDRQTAVDNCKESSSVAKIENTLQQLANVLVLTVRQDERLIAI